MDGEEMGMMMWWGGGVDSLAGVACNGTWTTRAGQCISLVVINIVGVMGGEDEKGETSRRKSGRHGHPCGVQYIGEPEITQKEKTCRRNRWYADGRMGTGGGTESGWRA